MINYEIALLFGLLAFVYTQLLTQPGAMLSGFYNRLYKFFKTDERVASGSGPHWLFMILIHCCNCVAGQMAAWYFLFTHILNYSIIEHAFFVAVAIASAAFVRGIYWRYIHTD
jgi:hypothetical protein